MNSSAHAAHTGNSFAAQLNHFSRTDLAQAGGKGANLGELIRAGFPVPPGFVVTTAAYDQFVTHNHLSRIIAAALGESELSGAAIRDAFEQAPIPPQVEHAILAAHRQLGPDPVAVRSSATAEDLPDAAFAGQQDTYLNILGAEALLDAVRRCWASLWTDRAIAYRERLGIDQQSVKLAVVVQQMVAAEAAGVLFTANTVTGARDEMVIDASPGLGEAIVSGLVTPDHFILQKQRWGWRITERRTGRREVIIRARPGGGTEHLEGFNTAETPAVPDRALHRLARTGAAIQQHFGSPQDIEWASANGKLFVLQARPITALPDPPPRFNGLQRLLASNFGEMLPVRPYPLDMSAWMPALSGAVEPIFEPLGLAWHLGQMFEAEDDVVVRFSGTLPRLTWRTLLAPVKLVALGLRYDPIRWESDPLLSDIHACARELESRDLSALSWGDLLTTLQEARTIPQKAGELRQRYFPRSAFAVVRLRLLLALMGHADQFSILLSGADNLTLQANRALEDLSDQIRSDPTLAQTFAAQDPQQLWAALEEQPAGRAFLIELRAFLDRYGHRETVISTALAPTWKDAPDMVLAILKGFAAHPPQRQPTLPTWEAARDEVLRHPLLRLAPMRSAFLSLLAAARVLFKMREDTHFYATMALPTFRRVSLEFGRRLTGAGVLDAPEEVFHLRLAELERINGQLPPPPELAAELRAAMLRRRQERARLEDTPFVDPRLFPHSAPQGDELLRGMPGSSGIAEGPARIVRDASEFDKLVAGEVLVAPYTNPSWTPLFQRAVAVIVDSGSPASHAAIVAREYGIPAVMGTLTGTRTLRDGQRVRVDGNLGAVFSAARPTQSEER